MGRSTEKYEYRKNKIPYRYEVTVARELGMSLKIYEFFDGENVKWCMGMDAETMSNGKTFNCTPLFDNIAIDEDNDKLRVFYRNESYGNFVLVGKLNGNEVLCEVLPGVMSNDKSFSKLYKFDGENVVVSPLTDDKPYQFVRVDYTKNGEQKIVLFDCKEFEPCINEVDRIYRSYAFLKSYIVNGKVRTFVGEIDRETKKLKPYGYDINKDEFIEFPTTSQRVFSHYDVIDDEEMMHQLEMEKGDIGFDIWVYRETDKDFIGSVFKLVGKEFDEREKVLDELSKRNNEKGNTKKK